MRRSVLAALLAILLLAVSPLTSVSVSAPANVPDAAQPALTTEVLFGIANETGNPYALEAQGGDAQIMFMILQLDVPAYNDKTMAINNAANTGVMIDDTGGGGDTISLRDRVHNLLDQATRVASGSRGGGRANGTAGVLHGAEGTALALSGKYLDQLTGALEKGDPKSDAYGQTLQDLRDLRTRLAGLTDSGNTDTATSARSLVARIDEALEKAYPDRAAELVARLATEQDERTRSAIAKELLDMVVGARDLPSAPPMGGAERAARQYYSNQITANINILNSTSATPAAKAAARRALENLRSALLEYEPTGPVTGSVRDFNPVGDLLATIEMKLFDELSADLTRLRATANDTSLSSEARSEAITEMFLLWNKLRELTRGESARRDRGDQSHTELIDSLRTELTALIDARTSGYGSTLDDTSSAGTLDGAIRDLVTAWTRLRQLGETQTYTYARVEQSLREAYRLRSRQLIESLDDPSLTTAERAAAATALAGINKDLKMLDAASGTADNPAYDSSRVDIEEKLEEYIHGRIGVLTGIVDSPDADKDSKAGALAELRQLRTILVESLGRSSAPVTGRAGDPDLAEIDKRLGALSTARLAELANTVRSSSATPADKRAAIIELQQLRSEIRQYRVDETGEIETQIDKLLEELLDGELQELKKETDGAGTGPPITRGSGGSGTTVAVNATENPDAIASSVASLTTFGMPGGPQLAALALSTGNSTGTGAFKVLVANAGPAANVNAEGLVVEPVPPSDKERVLAEWSRVVDAANAVVEGIPEGYCLEREKRPPSPEELFMISTLGKNERFAPEQRIIESGRRLADADQLHPEEGNDPEGYLHSILQWSIWVREGNFDEQQFTETFVQHTRTNLEANGFEWSDEIEDMVRDWAVVRWTDINNVLIGANLGVTG